MYKQNISQNHTKIFRLLSINLSDVNTRNNNNFDNRYKIKML